MRFSQKHGYAEVRKAIQTEGLDQPTRAQLWNKISPHFNGEIYLVTSNRVWQQYYDDFLEAPVPRSEQMRKAKNQLEVDFLYNWEWHKCLDFTEWVVQAGLVYERELQRILERHLVGYRFIGGVLTAVVEADQITAIEDVLEGNGVSTGAKKHIQAAVEELGPTRSNPAAAIREAINAVEAQVRKITGDEKATLPDCLKKIKSKHDIHRAFEAALQKLYGFTSDEHGIRHADKDFTAKVTQADAVFFLVTASAFVSWLIAVTAE